ncbi:uncharacterized protein [Ptychodera flava]|uniref:uncharacterized protein n=1 Tax=Ptychodera flava TaxID=63121 RepID=UPI00396AA077
MRVCVGSVVSTAQSLDCGVPQGSVIGPVLFSLYTAPLEDIIEKHGLESMFYADDSQLYITCSRVSTPTAKIENCIEEIRQWMSANLLALNDGKTEVIRFSSKFSDGGQPRACSLWVGGVSVHSSPVVRDLGVTLDATASMSAHITNLSIEGVPTLGSGMSTLSKRVPRDGHWHHVCIAWVGRIGQGRRWLYVDGTGITLSDGHLETLLGNGTLYLGFRPDIDFRQTVGFVGEMALFNMWDRHLNMDEIAAFAKECGDATEGNVVGWSAMFGGNAEREKTVERQKDFCSNGDCEDVDCMTEGACIDAPVGQCSCPSQTSCQTEGRKLQFDGSSRVDVNVNDRVTQIDSLSICLWLKISSSSGTLFSITTPTSTENNTIQNIEFLGFSLVVQTYGGNRHSWYSYLTLDPSKVTDTDGTTSA